MAKLTASRRARAILAGRATSVPFTAVLHGCERTTTDNPRLPRPAPLPDFTGDDPPGSGFASRGREFESHDLHQRTPRLLQGGRRRGRPGGQPDRRHTSAPAARATGRHGPSQAVGWARLRTCEGATSPAAATPPSSCCWSTPRCPGRVRRHDPGRRPAGPADRLVLARATGRGCCRSAAGPPTPSTAT